MSLSSVGQGLQLVLSWPTIGFVILGVLLGIFIGSLPGLGPDLGMAVMLPLTLPLEGLDAIILLVGIYSGALYGGSISAILINVPGTAASAATTFDGYPLTQQGKALVALTTSASASAIGGFFTVLALFALSPVLIGVVLAFGTPEYFLMAVLGLAMISVIAKGSILKGLFMGAFGFLIATMGVAPMVFQRRYTFDTIALYDGLDFVAILIGLFAISEMFKLANQEGGISGGLELQGKVSDGVRNIITYKFLMLKSAFIGMGVGSIPGAGATVANFLSYAEVVRSVPNPEIPFGEGNIRGLIASEASNNGTVGGSLIPTFSFGIPGSASTAVLLGGLLMHGLQPGPQLFSAQLHVTYSVFFALLLGNILILIIGLGFVSYASHLTRIDTELIIPIVIVLAMAGSFALRRNWLDPLTIVVLGIVGYYMYKNNYSVIAFILGVILGPIAEENFHRSLVLSEGSYAIFVTRPLSLLLVLVTVLVLIGPALNDRIKG
ncbi:tripartite tricarboxylate transporter permease [Halalkalicoccus ordinarius]|uniref:tripartite tricarboxylate transporter permease n=1 Tax=Halalkalicoccus ordinarius TaxID=3116651 RepID=UPI00300F66FE